jgi:hypothetical protein
MPDLKGPAYVCRASLSGPPMPMLTRPQQLGLLLLLFVFIVYVLLRVRA